MASSSTAARHFDGDVEHDLQHSRLVGEAAEEHGTEAHPASQSDLFILLILGGTAATEVVLLGWLLS